MRDTFKRFWSTNSGFGGCHPTPLDTALELALSSKKLNWLTEKSLKSAVRYLTSLRIANQYPKKN
jgi:hypothetical protein